MERAMRRALERIAARLGFVPRARLGAACPCGESVPAHAVVALTDGMSEIFVLRADLAEAARWFNEAILRWQAAEAELAAVRQRADEVALAGGRSVQLLLAQREAAHKEAAAEQRRGDRLALLLANLRRAAEAYLRSREDAALGALRQALAADARPMGRARSMFLVSDDDKRWTCAEEFTGREEAVAWGRAQWPARRIFTGKTAPVDLACLHGARVLAELVQHVEAQVGDKGRPGWPALPAPDAARLGAVLNAALHLWLEEHSLLPGFFTIVDVTAHEPTQTKRL